MTIGITAQFLRAFKNKPKYSGEVQASISYREHIHPFGRLVIYIKCMEDNARIIESLIHLIGYWGQGNSLTYCLSIRPIEPVLSECAAKLSTIPSIGLKGYQTCYLNDVDCNATWDEVISGGGVSLTLYVLPITLVEKKRGGRLLKLQPLPYKFAKEI